MESPAGLSLDPWNPVGLGRYLVIFSGDSVGLRGEIGSLESHLNKSRDTPPHDDDDFG